MSAVEENELAPFKDRSESVSYVKAAWNRLLNLLAFPIVSVLRIPIFSGRGDPKYVFLKWFAEWPNFLIF